MIIVPSPLTEEEFFDHKWFPDEVANHWINEDGNIVLEIPWCREVAASLVMEMRKSFNIDTFSFYGVRYGLGGYTEHKYFGSDLPAGGPMESYMPGLLNLGVYGAERIAHLGGGKGSIGEISKAVTGKLFFDLPCKVRLNEVVYEDIGVPKEDFDAPLVGSVTNIPADICSIPVTSWVLYIPRLWAEIAGSDTLTGLLNKCVPHSCDHGSRLAFLWSRAVARVGFPAWFTSYGKEHFWSFLHYLLVAPATKESHQKLERRGFDGYKSWTREYYHDHCRRMASQGPFLAAKTVSFVYPD